MLHNSTTSWYRITFLLVLMAISSSLLAAERIMIIGLNKADVLLALYNNAKFAGPGFASQPMMQRMARMTRPAIYEKAEQAINAIENGNYYFDYIDLG